MNNPENPIGLDELVEEFLERQREGEAPNVDEYVQRAPQHEQEIRELIQTLQFVHGLKDESVVDGPYEPAIETNQKDFPTIDDYEIVRVAGRGGMGVVYEANQISLSRRVALKVLPQNRIRDSVAVDRFRMEAKSAAGLHHSNIVPVFEVGELDDGCFYTMQFIEGRSLDFVLDDLKHVVNKSPKNSTAESPDPNHRENTKPVLSDTLRMGNSTTSIGTKPFYKNVANIGREVAEALAYAHCKGVVHRDIKPANLLLDRAGSIWVTDFGLAKTASSDLTRTGDVVGTLRYMAPERFTGKCNAASDVYSLGMTLYEMLVQRAAFPNTDQLSMIEAIKNSQPTPLRKIDPKLPRDLETVIAKALEKDPKRRYITAGEMASDLGRFVDGQPIRARRVGAVERLILWSKKEKPLAASLFALALLMIATTMGSLIAASYFRAQQMKQSDLANQNLALAMDNDKKRILAEKARIRSEESQKVSTASSLRSAKALKIFTTAFYQVAPQHGGKAELKASDVLRAAEDLLEQSDLDDLGRREFLTSLAPTFAGLGEFERAFANWEKLKELNSRRFGADSYETLNVDYQIAALYRTAGRMEPALTIFKELLPKYETAVGSDHYKTIVVRSQIAWADLYAYWQGQTERIRAIDAPPAVINHIREATQPLEEAFNALRLKREEGGDLRSLTVLMQNLAMAYVFGNQPEKAFPLFREAIELLDVEEGKNSINSIQFQLKMGAGLLELNRNKEAATILEESLTRIEEDFGTEHAYYFNICANLAQAWWLSEGKSPDGYAYRDKGFKLFESTLAKAQLNLPIDHVVRLGLTENVANLYTSTGSHAKAIPLRKELLVHYRNTQGSKQMKTMYHAARLASDYYSSSDWENAIPLYRELAAATDLGSRLQYQAFELECHVNLKNADEHSSLATVFLNSVRDLGKPARLAANLTMVGSHCLSLGQFATAEGYLVEALEIRKVECPGTWRFGSTQSAFGEALLHKNKLEEAGLQLEAGYDLLKKGANEIPKYGRKQALANAVIRLVKWSQLTKNQKELEKWKNELKAINEQ